MLAYHPLTDDWRVSPWACNDPGPLTRAEALNVLTTHGKCPVTCLIARTARKVLAENSGARPVTTWPGSVFHHSRKATR